MLHEEFEKIVMSKLLGGEHEILEALRQQYLKGLVTSREFTGCGFFTYFEVPESMALDGINGRIDDVKAQIIDHKGNYLFFILYITNGKFDVLECFTTQDGWEQDYNVVVEYCYETERRFEVNKEEIVTKTNYY